MKAIQLLVNDALPEDVRDYSRTYDSKSINELMTAVAEKHPESYGKIIDRISDIGRNAVYYLGETLTLKDFKPPFDKDAVLRQMNREVAQIKRTEKDTPQRADKIVGIYEKYATLLEKMTMDAAKAQGNNNLYNAVASGARGNPTQLKALITTPSIYTDYKGRTIPLFIKKSYAEGVTPAEYLASTYGTRSSVITIKRSTAEAGAIGKSFGRALADMVITSDKDYSDNGIDLEVDDPSMYGRVLARDAGGLKAGTVLDREALNQLQKAGVKKAIVHSPIATVSAKGIPAEAFGLDYNRRLPPVGFNAGSTVSTALSEPMIQGGLCLAKETKVRMADGSVKMIKDIQVGDQVLGADRQGNTFPVTVKNVFDQGVKKVRKYTFYSNSGSEFNITCTADHKFLMAVSAEYVVNAE